MHIGIKNETKNDRAHEYSKIIIGSYLSASISS